MHVRKFKSDKEALLKEGQAIVSESADNKFVHRVSLVSLMLAGISAELLSKHCGESKRTLISWVQKVDNDGWNSLMAKKQEGRPRRLNGEQEEMIRDALNSDPDEYGYNVWDGPSLSDYILKSFGVVLGVRACQNLMHRLGFSLIRPQTYPSLDNPDDETREAFKKKLNEISAGESLVLVFQDEVHFKVQTTITRKWARKGSEPKVMSKPGNNNVSYSGFLIPETGSLYVNKPVWFNYETTIQSFRDFIKQNPLTKGKKYLMILDNAPWHKKAIRLIWKDELEEYQDIRDAMEYINLPPYSPDLNPIEQVWRITRREKTHNRYFPSLAEITRVLDDFFATFVNGSEQLMSLCSFKCFA